MPIGKSMLPLLGLLGALIGCDSNPEPISQQVPAGTIVHPILDSLESHRSQRLVQNVKLADTLVATARYRSLALFDTATAMGVLEGPPDQVLGQLADAAITPTNETALLDINYGLIRFLTSNSQVAGSVGGHGQGPGNFIAPNAIYVEGTGVSVVDSDGKRIEHFSRNPDTEPRRTPIPFTPIDGCAIGSRRFVTGLYAVRTDSGPVAKTSAMVHELDPTGSVINSFSVPYRLADLTATEHYGNARIACDAATGGRLWVAYMLLGEVHAMKPDGKLLWIAKLTDLRYPNFHRTGRAFGVDPKAPLTRDYISNISLISDDALAVQVISRGKDHPTDRDWKFSYSSYLLHPQTGRLVGGFRAEHQVIGGGNGRGVLYRRDPFPQANVVTVER